MRPRAASAQILRIALGFHVASTMVASTPLLQVRPEYGTLHAAEDLAEIRTALAAVTDEPGNVEAALGNGPDLAIRRESAALAPVVRELPERRPECQ